MQVNWRDVLLGLSCFGSLCPGSILLFIIITRAMSGFQGPPQMPRV